MDFQTLFNVALSGFGFLAGFFLYAVWSAVKDLQVSDKELSDKVHAIETLVAGNYPTRDELERKLDALFSKLDRIEAKIDHKADKVSQ